MCTDVRQVLGLTVVLLLAKIDESCVGEDCLELSVEADDLPEHRDNL